MHTLFRLVAIIIIIFCGLNIWQQLTHWTEIPVNIVASAAPDRYALHGEGGPTPNEPKQEEGNEQHSTWYGAPSWLRHVPTENAAENTKQIDSLPNRGNDPYHDDLGSDREYQKRYPLGATVKAWQHPQLAPNGILERPSLVTGIAWRISISLVLITLLILPHWAANRGGTATCMFVGIGLAFFCVGAVLSTFFINPISRYITTAQWVEQAAHVESIRQGTYKNKFGTHWKGEIVYTYSFDGSSYTANRVDQDLLTSPDWESIISGAKPGDTITTLVNSEQPWRSILRNRIHEPLIFLIVGCAGICISLFGITLIALGLRTGKP